MPTEEQVRLRAATTTSEGRFRAVLEIRCGQRDGPPPPCRYHVLLDASGSMYYSSLPPEEIQRFTELARARNELAQVTSDGRAMWTVTGRTRDEMAQANRTPMQWVAWALQGFARALPHYADIALVAFASEALVLLRSQAAEHSLDAVLGGLAAQAWSGELGDGTRWAPALDACAGLIAREARPELRHRVLLLSDGRPEDPEAVEASFGRLVRLGASFTGIGLGDESDLPLLERMTAGSGGRAHGAAAPEDLPELLLGEIEAAGRLLTERLEVLVAPALPLRLTSAVQVEPEARILPSRELSGAAVLLALGPAEQGEARLVVLELASPGGEPLDARSTLGSVAVRLGPESGTHGEAWADLRPDEADGDLPDIAGRALLEEHYLRCRMAAQTAWSAGERAEAGGYTEQAAEAAARLGWADAARQLRWEVETLRGR